MEYLYKYYPIKDYALDDLNREEICFNTMSAFNDIQEGKFNMQAKESDPYHLSESLAERLSEDFSDLIIFQYRVLSLTTRYDMSYMWENYAQGGMGFCIEYNYHNLQNISTNIGRMDYRDNKAPHAYFEDSLNNARFIELVSEILFSKEEKWNNECEVRLIYKISQNEIELTDMEEFLKHKWEKASEYEYMSDIITLNHYKSPKRIMKKCIPNKIYLGPNINKDNEEKIREIISNRQYKCEKITGNCLL